MNKTRKDFIYSFPCSQAPFQQTLYQLSEINLEIIVLRFAQHRYVVLLPSHSVQLFCFRIHRRMD